MHRFGAMPDNGSIAMGRLLEGEIKRRISSDGLKSYLKSISTWKTHAHAALSDAQRLEEDRKHQLLEKGFVPFPEDGRMPLGLEDEDRITLLCDPEINPNGRKYEQHKAGYLNWNWQIGRNNKPIIGYKKEW